MKVFAYIRKSTDDERNQRHSLAYQKAEIKKETHRQWELNIKMPEKIRYNERSAVERVNARLKDEFGGRSIWVKGSKKVMTHLMFGILAITADQLLKFCT